MAGQLFLPHLGVQNDEALFAGAIYEPRGAAGTLQIGHSRFPLMLMSYLGTLKSWIYRPIFRVFGTGMEALRLPMLLAGALSVWLFFLLLRRVAGNRAAIIGCILLAADSTYLLTVCFDWGPVALQHLLLVGGMLLLMRFYQQGSTRDLAGGFLLFGLAMWDKALAAWMLGGFGVAGLVIFPRQMMRVITPRRIAVSVLAFALGALPLIIYNFDSHFATFHGNFRYDPSAIPGKLAMLKDTAAGPGLFGWLLNENWQTPSAHPPQGAIQKASAGISAFAGQPRHNLMLYAFALALVLAPLARGNALRAILFALIAMGVAWVQMAVSADAGASVHHTILLWPLPAMLIAVSFAAASRRLGRAAIPAAAVVTAAVALSGVLVTNEYYITMQQYGGARDWTDAIFRLSDHMKQTPARTVFCMDWGILDSLRLLNRGKLPLRGGPEQIRKPEMTEAERQEVIQALAGPGNVFLSHRQEYEYFKDNGKLLDFAAREGFTREVLASIEDSYGRSFYEVYRFRGPATGMQAAAQ